MVLCEGKAACLRHCVVIDAYRTSWAVRKAKIMFTALNEERQYVGHSRFRKNSLRNGQSQYNWNALFLVILDKRGIILFTEPVFFSRWNQTDHILRVRKLYFLAIKTLLRLANVDDGYIRTTILKQSFILLSQTVQQSNWSRFVRLSSCHALNSLGIPLIINSAWKMLNLLCALLGGWIYMDGEWSCIFVSLIWYSQVANFESLKPI